MGILKKCMRSKVLTSLLCIDVKCTFFFGGGGSKGRKSEKVLTNGCLINGSKNTLGALLMYLFCLQRLGWFMAKQTFLNSFDLDTFLFWPFYYSITALDGGPGGGMV